MCTISMLSKCNDKQIQSFSFFRLFFAYSLRIIITLPNTCSLHSSLLSNDLTKATKTTLRSIHEIDPHFNYIPSVFLKESIDPIFLIVLKFNSNEKPQKKNLSTSFSTFSPVHMHTTTLTNTLTQQQMQTKQQINSTSKINKTN